MEKKDLGSTALQNSSTEKTQPKKLKIALKKKTEDVNNFLTSIADLIMFVVRVVRETFSRGFEFNEFLHQCFQIGYKSLPLISITGAIMGLVLTIQSRPILVDFGAVSMLPGMVTISLIREMGPVITAATLMIPLLILYADLLGILGCWLGANIKGEVPFVLFIGQAFGHVHFTDLFPAVIKSFFFGGVIGLVGCYKGYNAGRGTESVGIAANSAGVSASFWVIIIDMIAVQLTDMLL